MRYGVKEKNDLSSGTPKDPLLTYNEHIHELGDNSKTNTWMTFCML